MPDILIRGLDPQALKRLKARAKRNGRSLQSEARTVLENAAGADTDKVAAMLDGWKRRFAGRRFSDSVDLIREDRNR
jgi:plasmid stability protein